MFSQKAATMDQIEVKCKDGRPVLIRPANLEDRDVIIQNINAICAEKLYLPVNEYVSTTAWEALFEDSTSSKLPSLLLVPEIDGQIVGHGRLLPGGYGYKDSHVVDVGIALTQEYRGLGIGSQLLACMIDWARLSRYEKMTATIMANNVHAQCLFRQAGFVQEGVRNRQFKIDDQYVDEILIALFLCNETFR